MQTPEANNIYNRSMLYIYYLCIYIYSILLHIYYILYITRSYPTPTPQFILYRHTIFIYRTNMYKSTDNFFSVRIYIVSGDNKIQYVPIFRVFDSQYKSFLFNSFDSSGVNIETRGNFITKITPGFSLFGTTVTIF